MFQTYAFQSYAFQTPMPPAAVQYSGGWPFSYRKRKMRWEVHTDDGIRYFDDRDEAVEFFLANEQREEEKAPIRVKRIGKAKVSFAGHDLGQFTINEKTGPDIMLDARSAFSLEKYITRMIELQLEAIQEEEEFMLLAAVVA